MNAISCLLVCLLLSSAPGEPPANAKNAQAVREVLAKERAVANAAWWGFDAEDATEALQAAVRCGVKKVIVPNMGTDWNVRPIQLVGNQELVLEAGVIITAKRGEYRGRGDSVFTAANVDHLTIRGYGATIRMHKEDYIVGLVLKDLGWQRWYGPYEKAEWRCPLVLRGCRNVEITGLTLRDSGGDGILICGGEQTPSTNIRIKDIVCDNNYRQGISVISVDGLVVEDCVFKNTWGTPPSSGVDLEPDVATEKVKGVVFRRCGFENNYGDGIEVFLANLKRTSDDVSILFEDCQVTSQWGSGMRVTKVLDDGPDGLIEFRNCVVQDTEGYGIKVQDKAADRARVRFVNCTLRNVAKDRAYRGDWTPIWLQLSDPNRVQKFGGLDFVDCVVEDSHDRPAIEASQEQRKGVSDITGSLSVRSLHVARSNLGSNVQRVTLKVEPTKSVSATGVVLRHVMVYHEPGRFGGWPANHGIWSWGNEILVGFSAGTYKDLGPNLHAIDRDKPEEHLLARSRDGGLTWQIENPSAQGTLVPVGKALHGTPPPGLEEKPWRDCPGGIDFTHPDFAMTLRMSDKDTGLSRFYYSTDRGHNWDGPFRLPLFGQKGIAARTDYLVNGHRDCMLLLTAAKQDNEEGRVICGRTTDGGKTWSFMSYIGPEPTGYAIMPSTVRLSSTDILTTIRCREESGSWIDAYLSRDNGGSWSYLSRPVADTGEGNPPALIRLHDGRLCLTYGYRAAPWGIYARLSDDGGRTWSTPIALREDGAGRDIGYPRSVERPDGKVVTIYYFWDRKTGPERYIAATIWDPRCWPR